MPEIKQEPEMKKVRNEEFEKEQALKVSSPSNT